MSASPEFFQPSPAPDYTPGLFVATAAADQHDDAYYYCHTPTGDEISYLRKPATCPPAPMKPRPPPSSACRKRLFAAAIDIVALNFDDLEDIFRPASLPNDKQQRRRASKNKLASARSSVGASSNLSDSLPVDDYYFSFP